MTAGAVGYLTDQTCSDNTPDRTLDREPDAARQYRVEIDGLRAVAVLSVIFHHYLVPGFRGGFVGVDVFFVISGFLIASHIDGDIREDRFSLLGFYERRIRRIFPGFFLMYALVLIAYWVVLFPLDLHKHSAMAVDVIAFLANVKFFVSFGDYGGDSTVALLHTWSLAVEEQFYLFFPLLMLVMSRYTPRGRIAVIGLLCLLSFASCVIVVRAVPGAAFYLTPFRAWELLAGALLALARLPPPRKASVRSLVALLGLLLIVTADLFFSYAIPLPGELTLLPCVGAVAIIHAQPGPTTLAGKTLGNPLMRRIGWWSYSLYLYHWPLFALTKYYFFDPLSVPTRCLLIVSTFLLGWLSWTYVEQPFRRPNALLGRTAVYALAASVGAFLILMTLVTRHLSDPRLYNAQQRMQVAVATPVQGRCRNTWPEGTKKPVCKLGDAQAPVDTLLWGDSHALALLPAFNAAYARHHEAVMVAQYDGCLALLDVYIREPTAAELDRLPSWLGTLLSSHADECHRMTIEVLDWIIQHHIRTVILAGNWTSYAESRFGVRLTDAQSPDNHSLLEDAQIFSRGLERILAVLARQNVRVFILEDVPKSVVNVPYALASAQRLGLHRDFRITRAQYEAQQHSVTEIFARLQKRYEFRILKPQDPLCAEGLCAIARDNIPLYSDWEHLAPLGADVVEPALLTIWSDEK
jgi:peptidoglycan/LPS O-acetylase OafA/YrhL